ncbi:MAG: DUF547 domain-containing protein [Gammaproteobacteria bacterium]|nr:DUF547 domain-containing protein [Gammaproteobacteria bacterium]MCP5424605.1 DUF547 domain-containing protein [Gammaproteobacteria bacterium]
MKKSLLALLFLVTGLANHSVLAFDQQHLRWDALLKKHVVWIAQGTASRVDYAGFQQDENTLRNYLQTLSAVSRQEFSAWSKPQQLAFLINAYNAFTIELILTRYPNLESIKDLGSLLRSPWKQRFFTLLGEHRNLDEIEHGMIRAKGVYDEPRIHVAVVCASIGCPALRDEAYVAQRLDAQLEDSFKRFLADRSRNRYNATSGQLEVSKIFDWYREDFSSGYREFTSLPQVFARYADTLADEDGIRQRIRAEQADIVFLKYDWKLNDIPR